MSGECSSATVAERLATQTTVTNPVTSSLKRALESTSRPSLPRAHGLFRNRYIPQSSSDSDSPTNLLSTRTNTKTCEVLTRFMVAQGIPFESIADESFRDFLRYFDPICVPPKPSQLETTAARFPGKPISLRKARGPISVTVDVIGNEDEKFLAFSIHYFESNHSRKNVVCLRKLMLSKIDGEDLKITLRRALSDNSYPNVPFTNLVCSNKEIADLLKFQDVSSRGYICFYDYISQFVFDLFQIPEFRNGIDELRSFVRRVKTNSDLYSKFRRMQLTRNAELDIPSVDSGSWQSTSDFLIKCLILDEAFTEFARRWNVKYISREAFCRLICLHRVLQQCTKYALQLSLPTSSISQVVPAIMAMRNYISNNPMGGPLDKLIKAAFTKTFQQLSSGKLSERYDMASLLDPRYAYREHIYQSQVWSSIEEKVIAEILNEYKSLKDSAFEVDLDKTIRTEFLMYRTCSQRSKNIVNPIEWWSSHQNSLKNLASLARDFLTCPAVTIDGSYFFGEGGKFKRVCQSYSSQSLENCLTIASHCQEFRGRGSSSDTIEPHLTDVLNKLFYQRRLEIATGMDWKPNQKDREEPPSKKNVVVESPSFVQAPTVPTSIPALAQKPEEELREVKTEEIVEVKEEIVDGDECNEVPAEPIPDPREQYPYFPKFHYSRKQTSLRRKCSLCNRKQDIALVKEATVEVEKLLLLYGSVHRRECTIQRARSIISRSARSCFCRVHFTEACDAIFRKMKVQNATQLPAALDKMDAMTSLVEQVIKIHNAAMDFDQFRRTLIRFVEKYSIPEEETEEVNEWEENSLRFERLKETFDEEKKVADKGIRPKWQRAPRKQVLDSFNDDEGTLENIERTFEFLDRSYEDPQTRQPFSVMCCLCSLVADRSVIIRLPRSKPLLARYFEHCGPELEERIDPDSINYVCRRHFPPALFENHMDSKKIKEEEEDCTDYMF